MKYFIDTEFIEGFHKPIFGKRRHFIDLISIGIVAEDGREYYAISKDFAECKASDWVKENVIKHLEPRKKFAGYTFPGYENEWPVEEILEDNPIWKSNKQIAFEIHQFINDPNGEAWNKWLGSSDEYFKHLGEGQQHEFYGYYCDYDWVLLCSLFGTMMDLPKGFPMYCIDIKQMIDQCENIYWSKGELKKHTNYPKQINEHNALADAKWNYELYKFLKQL